jgi:DNA-directed RNA polymerase beta subunit
MFEIVKITKIFNILKSLIELNGKKLEIDDNEDYVEVELALNDFLMNKQKVERIHIVGNNIELMVDYEKEKETIKEVRIIFVSPL